MKVKEESEKVGLKLNIQSFAHLATLEAGTIPSSHGREGNGCRERFTRASDGALALGREVGWDHHGAAPGSEQAQCSWGHPATPREGCAGGTRGAQGVGHWVHRAPGCEYMSGVNRGVGVQWVQRVYMCRVHRCQCVSGV